MLLKNEWFALFNICLFVFVATLCKKYIHLPNSNISHFASQEASNLDFEQGELGVFPIGWKTSSRNPRSRIVGNLSLEGNKSCLLDGDYMFQEIDATPFLDKRVRFRAAVRTEPKSKVQLLLGVYSKHPDGQVKENFYFYNMYDKPITTNDWKYFEIVANVSHKADTVSLGVMHSGHGTAWLDNFSIDVVESTVPLTNTNEPHRSKPGLYKIRGDQEIQLRYANTGTIKYPLPLAYRDQAPVSYSFQVTPEESIANIRIEKSEDNHFLVLDLKKPTDSKKLRVQFESEVLVGPSRIDYPESATVPKQWPTEAQQWMKPTWCVDSDNERIREIAARILKSSGDDVRQIIANVESESENIFGNAKGSVSNLTAVEALDARGSCTSNANLVAALLRACNVPARVLAGYPSWSGPLQTHYIVEAYLPNFGWYPIESSRMQSPWPNSGQVNVSIVPIAHEQKDLAGQRNGIAGGVPYLTLEEPSGRYVRNQGMIESVTHKHNSHECELQKPIHTSKKEWATEISASQKRWTEWLADFESSTKNVQFDDTDNIRMLK